ncbi:hypothetical protein TWF506_004344 [Arthrobotrys conoides]|uniref:Uncharacterized protein n=1 Tax=Arthrobotrys conoides TaxID=74498 RepID=A0AAN8N2Z8_9PEZI
MTITPTPMSGRILMYDRGEYNTNPGSLSANYLAPTNIHSSIANPTVVAELVRTDGWSSIFHLDGFGGHKSKLSELETTALVPEEEIDGYVLRFVTF